VVTVPRIETGIETETGIEIETEIATEIETGIETEIETESAGGARPTGVVPVIPGARPFATVVPDAPPTSARTARPLLAAPGFPGRPPPRIDDHPGEGRAAGPRRRDRTGGIPP